MKNRKDERNLKNNCFLLREGFGKKTFDLNHLDLH